MKIKRIYIFLISLSSVTVLLAGCVSQGSYDAVVKERDQLTEKNRALENELSTAQNEKEAATKDLQAAKDRINATNRVIIESYGKLVDARAKVMTTQELYDNLVNKLAYSS